MDSTDETPKQAKPHVLNEYQDPHFHDEEPEPAEDGVSRTKPSPHRPAPRRMPPPKRRFGDD